MTLNYDNNADHQRVFIFSSGAIIAWGLRPNVLRALFSLLRAVESDPISQRLAEQEHEILLYTLDGGQRSFLRKGLIHLADQDLPTVRCMVSRPIWCVPLINGKEASCCACIWTETIIDGA